MSVGLSALWDRKPLQIRTQGRRGPRTKTWSMRIGVIAFIAFVLAAVAAPLLSPYDPVKLDLLSALQRPSFAHPFGTDHLGRDVLARVIYGAQVDLQIGLIFSVVVIPITFLGCVYYPWAALGKIPWLQYGVLINPIVYMSEGLRASLTPSMGHMPDAMILAMLLFFLALLTWVGMRGFRRRVVG